VEAKEPDRGAPTQSYEGIRPDAIRPGKIAFDLAGEAAPVVEDPEGMGMADQDIWTVNPDGSHLVQLTANSSAWDENPAWSPDGRRIAFSKWDPGGGASAQDGKIVIMDPDGSDRIEIPAPADNIGTPIWSPDGQRIAFTSSCGIYVANADGSGTPKELSPPRLLGLRHGASLVARWHPDSLRRCR
jgi:dipeptidyl aminopeptidase/acylaminoacyl peptidase